MENKILRKKIFRDRIPFDPETEGAPLAVDHPLFGHLFERCPYYELHFRFNHEPGMKAMTLQVVTAAGFRHKVEGNTLDEIFTQVLNSIQDWVELDEFQFDQWELYNIYGDSLFIKKKNGE